MILLKRDDGYCLNLTAAKTLTEIRAGLLVEMSGTEYYIVPGYCLDHLAKDTGDHQGGVMTIPLHWQGWNTDKHGERYKD